MLGSGPRVFKVKLPERPICVSIWAGGEGRLCVRLRIWKTRLDDNYLVCAEKFAKDLHKQKSRARARLFECFAATQNCAALTGPCYFAYLTEQP
jgi:hypothetical protein